MLPVTYLTTAFFMSSAVVCFTNSGDVLLRPGNLPDDD